VRYELWDVFTGEPFAGNPLAVVPDARGLTDAQMQRIANEFNLSETSFVLPSEGAEAAGVCARYFTPAQELPMAGHPSVGTVFALEKAGAFAGKDRVTLTLNIGPVEMTLEREGVTGRDGGTLKRVWMNQGVPELLDVFDKAEVARALGLDERDLEADLPAQLGSAGNPFLLVPVVSLDALARVQVSLTATTQMLHGDHRGVLIFTRNAPEADVRARMFGVTNRLYEDPATGSAHGPLGAYLAAHTDILQDKTKGDSAEFVSHQGVEMGRKSELFVRLERVAAGVQVSVSGAAVQVGAGELFL